MPRRKPAPPAFDLSNLYHGTSQALTEFMPSPRGTFGSGVYLISDLRTAFTYAHEDDAAVVMQAQVELQTPYVHQIREPEVVECWGEGLVLDLFGQQAASMLTQAVNGSGDFGPEIQAELMRRGHDGLVAIYPTDGSCEVVVFDPAAVTIIRAIPGAQVRARLATPLSKQHLSILQHTTGADAHGQFSRGRFRNHYVAGGSDADLCRELVAQGLMLEGKASALTGGSPVFMATADGYEHISRHSPPPPQLTRSQRRFRDYLATDGCFGDFRQYLAHIKRERDAERGYALPQRQP